MILSELAMIIFGNKSREGQKYKVKWYTHFIQHNGVTIWKLYKIITQSHYTTHDNHLLCSHCLNTMTGLVLHFTHILILVEVWYFRGIPNYFSIPIIISLLGK